MAKQNTPPSHEAGEPAPKSEDGVRAGLRGALTDPRETSEVAASIARFKEQFYNIKPVYETGPDNRDKCTWVEAERRLTENNNHYLKLAAAMNGGGVLFGIDDNGRLLFADAGKEPIMLGMDYYNTRKAVMFKEEEGKETPTGYVMFPYSQTAQGSYAFTAYEAYTGEPFVEPENKEEWRGSWLDSGEHPVNPSVATFVEGRDKAYVSGKSPDAHPYIGVRRLLMV